MQNHIPRENVINFFPKILQAITKKKSAFFDTLVYFSTILRKPGSHFFSINNFMIKFSLIYVQQLILCNFCKQNASSFNSELNESLFYKDKIDTNTKVSTKLAIDFILKLRNQKI